MNKAKAILRSDYVVSVITRVLVAIIGLISSAYSTRYLGVAYKGDYAYIVQIANIAMLVLNLGIYQSYSYNFKKYGKETIHKYTNVFCFQFIMLIILSGLVFTVFQGNLISLAFLLVPFNTIKLQYENVVLIENIKLRMKLNIFNSVFNVICYILLYYFAETHIIYLVGMTLFVDLVTILYYSIKLRIIPKIWELDFSFFKEVLRFGFIPMLSALLATINYSIDIIFLKHIGIPEELSYYALAAGIINYVWMLPDAFKDVLFSKSARKFDRENILFSAQLSSLFISACFIGFAVLGRFLITLVYGAEFVNSYGVTLLLIIGAFSMSIYKLLGVVLVSQGRRIAHFLSLAVSATINLILNAVLIPGFGMYGAGIASVCSYTVCGLILLIYFCRLYSFKPIELVFPTRYVFIRIKSALTKNNEQ